MKAKLFIVGLLIYASQSFSQTQLSGDQDYDITFVTGYSSLAFNNGNIPTYMPDCNDFTANLNFSFPSRETDMSNNKTTYMTYIVYKLAPTTNTPNVAYYHNGWLEYMKSSDAFLTFSMSVNGHYIDIEPNSYYYVKVITKRGNILDKPDLLSFAHEGLTETIYFGSCRNNCSVNGLEWILEDLQSSASNESAGLYYPKYESFSFIESSTSLEANENLILDAETYVYLRNGFYAVLGSHFEAYIDGCGGARRVINLVDQPKTELNFEKRRELNETIGNDVLIYPNPNNGSFKIKSSDYSISKIQILDMMGKVIFDATNIDDSELDIGLIKVQSGIYFVRFMLVGNNKYETKKIIIN